MGPFLSAFLLAFLAHAAYFHLQGPRLGLQQEVDPPPITCNILGHDDAVERFSKLLQFPTVGNQSEPEVHISLDRRPHFHALLDYLPTAYRAVWSKCSIEMVGAGDYTLLIKWEGSNPSLLPLLFISHYDVVPVTEGTDQDWLHGPFSGAVADGFIWGRGALDIKFTVAALLETMNIFIEEGFVPERTIYVTFGHDEEVGGTLGAARVAKLLQQRGIEFEIIVDEGGTIFSDGLKPLTSSPVALVGTSEKVYTMVQVTLNSSGGHSSMPPVDGSDVATQMGKLLTYVQSHPFPSIMRPPFSDLLKTMASYTSNRVLQYLLPRCDTWPLQWLILRVCASSPTMAAQVRTTVAATKLWAGVAENVLPQQGHVLFNLRSHPHGTSEEQAVEYFREALHKTGASGHAEVAAGSFHGAQRPAVTNSSGPHFAALKMAIRETWRHDGKGIGVVPMLMTGGTDSKHYAGLTRHGVLRFTPYTMNQTAGDLRRVHGTNERVPVHDFKRALCTYRRLIFLLSEGVMTPDEVL